MDIKSVARVGKGICQFKLLFDGFILLGIDAGYQMCTWG